MGKTGFRIQESEIRSQKSEVGNQKSEDKPCSNFCSLQQTYAVDSCARHPSGTAFNSLRQRRRTGGHD